MDFIYHGVSLQNRRSLNMDSLLLKSRSIGKHASLLAVVCDGVGSLADGAYASGTAVKMLEGWLDNLADAERIGLKMRDAILEINAYITAEAKKKEIQTASTLSALLLLDGAYYLVHIGDSRIYLHDGTALSPLTRDDVSETGKLSGCIGQGTNITLQYAEGMAWKSTFLVCSDGLYKRINTQFLADHINANSARQAKESVKNLTKYVIDHGEQDNITVALLKIAD